MPANFTIVVVEPDGKSRLVSSTGPPPELAEPHSHLEQLLDTGWKQIRRMDGANQSIVVLERNQRTRSSGPGRAPRTQAPADSTPTVQHP